MTRSVEVAILGAGFGGLTMAHGLMLAGIDDFTIFERDIPSHLYSLSFAPKPDWSRAYATQPEILDYVERCYDRVRCPGQGAVQHRDRRGTVEREHPSVATA